MIVYKKAQVITTYVWYSIIKNITNNTVVELKEYDCFSTIIKTDWSYLQGKTILYHIPKVESCYDKDSILLWIEEINQMKFKCNYLEENDLYYIIKINSEDYHNKSSFLYCGYLIRYLTEADNNELPAKYWEILQKIPDIDKVSLLLLCHYVLSLGAGHNIIIYYSVYQILPTIEIIWKKINNLERSTWTYPSNIFNQEKKITMLNNIDRTNYIELYNALKPQEEYATT